MSVAADITQERAYSRGLPQPLAGICLALVGLGIMAFVAGLIRDPQKTWLAFPAFFTHYPSPPNWPLAEDGVWDTRIMHSRDGIQWHYLGDEPFAFGLDRSAFLAKGPMGGLPIPNEVSITTNNHV